MSEALQRLDVALFLALNGWHAPWADALQDAISRKWIWLPLYAWLGLEAWRAYGRRTLWLLGGLALLVVACDQSASLVKAFVQRPRPCNAPALTGLVHAVASCGGDYGFVSGHAINAMGPAVFLHRLLPPGRRAARIGMALYVLAIGYSRVYLGKHYPGDVLGGWLLGAGLGFAAAAPLRRWLGEPALNPDARSPRSDPPASRCA